MKKIKSYRKSAFYSIHFDSICISSFLFKKYTFDDKNIDFKLQNYILFDSFFDVLSPVFAPLKNNRNTKYIFDKNLKLNYKNAFYLIHFYFIKLFFFDFRNKTMFLNSFIAPKRHLGNNQLADFYNKLEPSRSITNQINYTKKVLV